jgi:nitrate/nitrite-specific signal transduction histidine kinase
VQPHTGSAFYRSLVRLDLRMESRVYLVDSRGRAIYHHDPGRVGSDVSDQAAVQAVQAGLVGAWRGFDGDSEEIVASYAPIPHTLVSLVEEESWTDLRRISLGYGRVLVAILLFAVLVPATIVSIAIRRITRPIKNLTIRADAISRGELSQIVDVPQGSELAELAQAFNRMSSRLESFYADLESRVDARTRELSAMNEIAGVVSQSLDLDDILAAALDKVLELMHMGAGTAYELEPGTDTLRLIAQRGLPSEALSQRPEISLSAFVPHESLAEGAQVWTQDRYPRRGLWRALARENWKQIVLVPLVRRGELIGLLNLRARNPRDLGEQELALLTGIGSQVGIALENARLYREAGALAVMAERNRLAQDLHDSVTQTIFTVNLLAGVIPTLYEENPEEAQFHLEELARLTRSALNEMRALLLELRPAALAQTPLEELLARLGESTAGSARMPVHVSADSGLDIPPRVRVALYRIAQEAINNVVKHSGADQAWIRLRRRVANGSPGVELMVRDDGQGFDPSVAQEGRLGLSIIHERASDIQATLTVQSAPGGGTTVRILWFAQESPQEQQVPDVAVSGQRR